MKKRIYTLLMMMFLGLGFSCTDSYQEAEQEEIIEIKATDDDGDEDIILGPDGKPITPNVG